MKKAFKSRFIQQLYGDQYIIETYNMYWGKTVAIAKDTRGVKCITQFDIASRSNELVNEIDG